MRIALVLGAAVWVDGQPSPTFRLRVSHAVALWRAGAVDAILVSGGRGRHGAPEGDVGCALAAAMGVPAEALRAETVSRSTVENLALSRPLLRGAEVVIVSNRWHLPRARLAAFAMGLRATGSGPRGTMSWLRTLRAVLREGLAVPGTLRRALRYRRSG